MLPPLGTALPPEGGQVPLNYCMTVGLAGANRLQLLFKNDLGGAVWSEFDRKAGFGAGAPRTMTTGRSIGLPAGGAPDLDPPDLPPTLGGAVGGLSAGLDGGSSKPGRITLREFELLYEIKYNATPVATGRAPLRRLGEVTGVRPGRDAPVLADPDRKPEEPCRPL
ncbi:MAG: hypothetical protein WD076_01045 [Parvularculaceae bacterium]